MNASVRCHCTWSNVYRLNLRPSPHFDPENTPDNIGHSASRHYGQLPAAICSSPDSASRQQGAAVCDQPDDYQEMLAMRKMSGDLLRRGADDPEERISFVLYGKATANKGLRRVLECHDLEVDPYDVAVVNDQVTFTGRGTYSSFVSVCAEDWVESIQQYESRPASAMD